MISVTAMALGLGSLVVAGAASAAGPSPYAGRARRDIKALSPQQIERYLEGRGMRMALAAELNGYIQNYQRLRGYASAMRSGEHGHDHAGHGEQ